jgi:hypothetical protein
VIGARRIFLGWVERTSRRLVAMAVVAIGVLVVPATALAADPTEHQYGSTLDQISGGGTDPGEASSSVGGLPFTGFDVALLAAVAAALLIAGLALRRHRPESPPT